jgi:hypothetical protein
MQNTEKQLTINKQHRRNQMKFNKWTVGLAAVGAISLASAARADEKMSMVQTALSNTTISGYVDVTASWKLGTGDVNLPGRTYDGGVGQPYNQDGFNLNVVSLTLDKPEDDAPWASGYHVQLLLGDGAQKRGSGILQPTGSRNSLAFNEAYIALRVPVGNGIDFHVGQFGTYNGYEAYDTFKDPNYSRSYGFFIESSAHTGISATYAFTPAVTLMAGVADAAGFNNQVDAQSTIESKKAYLTMLTLTAPDSWGFLKGATLSGGYTVGEAQVAPIAAGANIWNQGNIYAGASIPLPVTGLSLGLAYDYTYGLPANGVNADASDYANATAVYLTYSTGNWTFANRVDYASGTSGSFGYFTPAADKKGSDQLASETFTVGYAFWKNVITRAEFRWDHALSAGKPFGGTPTSPAPGDKNALSVALEAIYQF